VTFYLTDSRDNSYYTQVSHGSAPVKLELGANVTTAWSQKVEDSGIDLPGVLNVPWVISFVFDNPVSVIPGQTEWKLLDVDDNPATYSAVILHMSDVQDNGLPGRLVQGGCTYKEDMDTWYSATFELEDN